MNKKAFSLVETLIALAFFMTLVIPYIAMFLTSARDVKKIGGMNVAVILAQHALEACKSYPVERLDMDDDSTNQKYFLEYAFTDGSGEINIIPDTEDAVREEEAKEAEFDKYWKTIKVNGIQYERTVNIKKILPTNKYTGAKVNLKLVEVNVKWKSGDRDVNYKVSCVVGG